MDYLEKDFKEEVEQQVEELKESKYLKNADWNEVIVLSGAQKQQEYIQQLNKKVKEQEKDEEDKKKREVNELNIM